MANVLEYLQWRGDLRLEETSLNEVDAMILARISYIPFDGIVPENFNKSITLKNAAELFLEQEDCAEKILWYADLEFLAMLKESKRFGNMELSGYVNQVDAELQKQFCAVTIKMHEKTYYVSYRGTDNTLVGWKEDFNMAFMTPIPSQKSACEYFVTASECLQGEFYLGGHSKGGNLAVYAAASCDADNQDKIVRVYNFDGPGFEHNFHAKKGYISISERICTYIPQSSVIGMLLDHEEEYVIVKSSRIGIMQHDIHSWNIMGKSFVKQENLTKESRMLDASLKEWVAGMNYEQRQQFVDTVYMVFKDSDAGTTEQLVSQWYKNIGKIVISLKNMNELDKKNVIHTMHELLKILTRNII